MTYPYTDRPRPLDVAALSGGQRAALAVVVGRGRHGTYPSNRTAPPGGAYAHVAALRALERAGLVYQTSDSDGRSVRYYPTETGRIVDSGRLRP